MRPRRTVDAFDVRAKRNTKLIKGGGSVRLGWQCIGYIGGDNNLNVHL